MHPRRYILTFSQADKDCQPYNYECVSKFSMERMIRILQLLGMARYFQLELLSVLLVK